VFWSRGQTATLTVDGQTREGCQAQSAPTPWDEARLLGAEYRAFGSEPAWSLEMDDGSRARFTMEGASAVYVTMGNPTGDAARRVYRSATDSLALQVVIEEKPCVDRGTNASLPHTVTVTFQGFPYLGCGRELSAP
jgi:putative lipoprotein